MRSRLGLSHADNEGPTVHRTKAYWLAMGLASTTLKRGVDLAGAVSGLSLLGLPLLGVAALIRRKMGSPVLFRQERMGLGGHPFRVFKFRTMVVGAVNLGSGLYLSENDARVPPLGRFLRRTSIDEIPQLLNVLLGEMSLVGPRPMVPEIVEQYQAEYEVILKTKPGLTGLAQVSGRENLSRTQRLALDIEYVRNKSLLLDLRILWATVFVVCTGEGQRESMTPGELER